MFRIFIGTNFRSKMMMNEFFFGNQNKNIRSNLSLNVDFNVIKLKLNS